MPILREYFYMYLIGIRVDFQITVKVIGMNEAKYRLTVWGVSMKLFFDCGAPCSHRAAVGSCWYRPHRLWRTEVFFCPHLTFDQPRRLRVMPHWGNY
jgi:hypothetical protein